MSNPNISTPLTIYGGYATSVVTNSLTSVVTNSASSGKVYKINSIYAANVQPTLTEATLDVCINDGTTDRYIAKNISVPRESTQVILSRDIYLYLLEGYSLKVKSSQSNSNIHLTVVYDDIKTVTLVTDGLIFHVDAGDSSSYGGSGTTWTDLSGSSNDASISNNTYNTGESFTITSTSDNTLSGINLTGGSFSIEMWIYRVGNSHDGTEGQIFTQDSGEGSGQGWQWKITNSDAKVRFVYWTGSSRGTAVTIVSDTALSNDTWYQLVVTYDGTTIKMYQNKTEVHSSNPSSSLYGSTTAIGIGMFNQTLSYDQRFNGKIAIIRAYDDKSLTATEVTQNFNATSIQ